MYYTFHFKLRHLATLFLLFLLEMAVAQQNQKIVYPNLNGFPQSLPAIIINTPDGGYALAGEVNNDNNNRYTQIPRIIKINAAGQSEWDNTYLTPAADRGAYIEPTAMINAPDGGWMLSVRDDSTGINLLRVAANGTQLWKKNIGQRIILLGETNGSYYGYTSKYLSPNNYQWVLHQIAADGTILSSLNFALPWNTSGGSNAICMTSDKQIQVFHTQKTNGVAVSKLMRYNLNGSLIWEGQPLSFSNVQMNPATNDGGVLLMGVQNKLYRYDAQGNLVSQSGTNPAPDIVVVYSFTDTPDGGLLLGGNTVTQRGAMVKLGADYSVQWTAEAPEDGQPAVKWLKALPTPDGWGIGLGETATKQFAVVRAGANTGITVKTLTGQTVVDANKNCIVETQEVGVNGTRVVAKAGAEEFTTFSNTNGNYTMILPPGNYTVSATPADQFFFTCPSANQVPVSIPANQTGAVTQDFPIQSLELIHRVSGTVKIDENKNCTDDNGDTPAVKWFVEITGDGKRVVSSTGINGQYVAWLPNGNYDIRVLPLNHNFEICSPATTAFSLNNTQAQSLQFDFLSKKNADCTILNTYPSANFFRPCSTSVVTILYQNTGTKNAENVQIKVFLDPLLTYESSTLTPSGINGNELTFTIPALSPSPSYQYSSFNIVAKANCSLQIGQQVCVTSSIGPNEFCNKKPGWNGAIVSVSGACNSAQNEAVYKIRNIGNAQNSQQLEYIVAEDQIVLRTGSFQLNPGDSLTVKVPYTGATQTITAQQEPGFPGDTTVSYSLTNCAGMGSFSGPTGFNGNAGPFTQQRCFSVSNSFDPNDKQAQPEGYGAQHIVWPGTPLEYKIRFQNTGNDTAFLVVIRDTLSADLDPSSISLLSSSHPYRFDMLNNRILQFTFDNIKLPDSSANVAGSQGFLDFLIRPRRDLPLGSKVGNRAAIYFDYNKPVITNTVWRTFDEYFQVTATENPGVLVSVKVFPNPTTESATLQLPQVYTDKNLQFEVTNAMGILVNSTEFLGNNFVFQRSTLPGGVYFWTISDGGKRIAAGKIVMQ